MPGYKMDINRKDVNVELDNSRSRMVMHILAVSLRIDLLSHEQVIPSMEIPNLPWAIMLPTIQKMNLLHDNHLPYQIRQSLFPNLLNSTGLVIL